MSSKLGRIEKEMVREVSHILQNEVKDTNIRFVTITSCRVSGDLSYAKVYYTVLREDKKEETKKALSDASGFIRRMLADRMDIRHTPELTFIFDDSIAYGKKIEDILEQIKEKENEK